MTVIKRVPNRDTSHRGMLSNRPTPSMAVTISLGRVAAVVMEPPSPLITVCVMPPQILKIAVIISIHRPTAVLARIKRIRWRSTYSGLWKSRKLAALWKIAIAKNSTNRP